MQPKRIVIVEDEADMAELVALRLKREGYAVDVVYDGLEALRRVRSDPPDLVLLDLMLPKLSGSEVANELRSDPRTAKVPIVMLTAKSEDSDIVVGLQLGADDYVTKPFSMSVLMARVSAVLRRSGEPDAGRNSRIAIGPISIDQERHLVELDEEPIQLTLTEFRILVALAAAKGRVLTRNQLIDQAMGMDAIVTDRTIDVHLTALRKKLGEARRYIKTVRGLGYRMSADDDSS